jgi:asparagine synthase (glutamine-hydrolysing)
VCGIAGLIAHPNVELNELLDRAHRIQAHRGPDAIGSFVADTGRWRVGLAHQRLSILDLSADANQPMRSRQSGWLIFNGEIYNYVEIRDELAGLGWTFKTSSDTEVLLAALDQWDVQEALTRCNGMWAFAWLDQARQRLVLARDRAGEKPLFHYQSGNTFTFASELKTILEMSSQKFSMNLTTAAHFLKQSISIATPETFFHGIYRLPAAHYGIVDLTSQSLAMHVSRYWTPKLEGGPELREADVAEDVRGLFFDSVRLRLRSDVPVGVLLSGGLDSSSIAAAMHTHLGERANLNLLAAVSADSRFDESPFIDRVADHLQRPVHKVLLDLHPSTAMTRLEEAAWFHDEPVGSFSTVAHFLLMKRAKELGITVVLSGQGADELLCGYLKYLAFYVIRLTKDGHLLKAQSVLRSFKKNKTILNQFSLREAKRYFPRLLQPPQLTAWGPAIKDIPTIPLGIGRMTLRERQKADLEKFSIPILTHYEDRMSMAWSREIRLPFLDHRLIDYLLPLPDDMKLRDGWTKYIFRRALEPFLPSDIIWRKDKQSFPNPQGEWLKNELSDHVLQYFGPDSLIFRHGLVDRAKLLRLYSAYRSQKDGGYVYSTKDVFNPLSLEIYLRRFEKYLT